MTNRIIVILVISVVCLRIHGWHIADKNPSNKSVVFVRGFLACPCSFSNAGANMKSLHMVDEALADLNKRVEDLKLQHVNDTELETLARVRKVATDALKKCAKKYQYQICINADQAIRGKYKYGMCNYDRSQGDNHDKNVVRKEDGEWVTTGK